ncbi:BRO family protein [Roseobacteraceae bacterium NS-SX3]
MRCVSEAGIYDLIDIAGEPWFVAKDVFEALAYPSGSRSYQLKQVGQDEVGVVKIQTPRGVQPMKTLSESGLYKLIMRSDKLEARAFQDWVTRDVFPAIRKDGGYIMGEEKVVTGEMSEDELVLKAVAILQGKVERLKQERDTALQQRDTATLERDEAKQEQATAASQIASR